MTKQDYPFSNVVDGKDDYADGRSPDQNLERVRDLEEILGVKEVNPFKTTDANKFESDIQEMSLNDLRTLAVKSGVFPSGNKTSLKNKLRKECKSRARGGANRAPYQGTEQFDESTKKKVEEISKRGK